MSRYYFDLHEGEQQTVDDGGTECLGIEAAQYEAIRALSEITRMEAPSDRDWASEVRVRNEAGEPVFVTKLALTAQRL